MAVVSPEFKPDEELPESITFVRFDEHDRFDGTFEVYPKLYKLERTLEFFLRNGKQAFPLKNNVLEFPAGKSLDTLTVDDVRDQFLGGKELTLEDFESEEMTLEVIAQGISKYTEAKRTRE